MTGAGVDPGMGAGVDVASIPQLVGAGATMRAVRQLVEAAARSSGPVLVSGETGTGKGLVARGIHELSSEAEAPLVTVLCPALQREPTDFRRLVVRAAGGGILLEEVDEMPLADQEILAAVLRDNAAAVSVATKVRCFATTRGDLETLTREGRFHVELYGCLVGIRVDLPPLRERRADLADVAAALLAGPCARAVGELCELTARALLALVAHDWPGNVRELENVLERASVLARGPFIEEGDVEAALASPRIHWSGRRT